MKIRFRLLLWVHFVFIIVSCLLFFSLVSIFFDRFYPSLPFPSYLFLSASFSFNCFFFYQSRRILLRSLEAMLIQTQDDSDSQLSCPYLPTYLQVVAQNQINSSNFNRRSLYTFYRVSVFSGVNVANKL